MQQLTLEWLQEKIGALYIVTLQLQDMIQKLGAENAELRRKLEPVAPKEPSAE